MRGRCLRVVQCFILYNSFVMSSFFQGWSAYDIVGPLNKAEIRAALLDFQIERSCFRTWDSIEDMILSSSDEVKRVVYESAVTKKNVEDQHRLAVCKRHLENQTMERNTRHRLGF